MSREFSIRAALSAANRSGSSTTLPYNRSFAISDDLLNGNFKGPSPGAFDVPTTGVDVDLSALTSPGWAILANLSSTYTIEFGIHDGTVFHPLGELPPLAAIPFKFSTNLGEEHTISGTGTTTDVNTFHMKSYGGTATGLVEAFER